MQKLDKWTKISDIEQEDWDGVDLEEIFFKGDFVRAAHYAQKKNYKQFTLTEVSPADETDPGYIEWMKKWNKDLGR